MFIYEIYKSKGEKMSEELTHKEIGFALKEINNKLENLQKQITDNKREFKAHIDLDGVNLE